MPSFDISSKVDLQTLDNAINTVNKEISNRFDFKGSHTVIELDKKSYKVSVETDSEMKMQQIEDLILTRSMRHGIDAKSFDFSKDFFSSGKLVKKEIFVKNGIDKEQAKKIVKIIKDSGLKVQAAIMDDIIRVSAKKIDDLQSAIQLCKSANIDLPLQFTNMKS